MMIRSVKTAAGGNSASDISKQAGLSNSHRNNNSLYQGGTTTLSSASLGVPTSSSSSSVLLQQDQTQKSYSHHLNSSYGDLFSENALIPPPAQFIASKVSNPNNNNNNNKFSSTSAAAASTKTSNAGSSSSNYYSVSDNDNKCLHFIRKKPATILPIFYKSKELYDRITKSATTVPTTTGSANNVVGSHQTNKGQFVNSLPQPSLQQSSQQNYSLEGKGMVKMKKMEGCEKIFWERSLNLDYEDEMSSLSAAVPNVSASRSSIGPANVRSPRKRKREDLKSSLSSLFQSSKKLKFQQSSLSSVTQLPMPNLLKSFSTARNPSSTCSSTSSAPSSVERAKSPILGDPNTSLFCHVDNSLSTSLGPAVKTCDGGAIPPIENIFLKKYDPIRLLIRLRRKIPRPAAAIVKSVISPPKRKIIYYNDFPHDKAGNSKRDHVNNNNAASNQLGLCFKRKSKLKSKIKFSSSSGQHDINMWSLSSVQVTNESKRKCKAIRLPKHQTRTRKVRVRFRSQSDPNGISEDRLRLLAAVYLKRALVRQRHSEYLTSEWFGNRLKRRKAKRKQRRGKLIKVGEGQKRGQVFVKMTTENGVSNVHGSFTNFRVTNFNLPKPLPIETRSYSLVENPFPLHTVELLRHKRELQDRLDTVESDGTIQKVGSLPQKKENDLTKPPLLTENVLLKRREVKHIISQKLLMCLATVGFTHSKLRPLEGMADATSNFMTSMAQRLKEVSEMEMYGADHGFPDAMERVLNEHGIGGIRGLEDFYRTQVNDYGNRMEEQCLQLRRQYAYKVRSKIGMMSTNVNTPNLSAPSPSSSSSSMSSSSNSSSVNTTISAPTSSTTNNNAATLSSSIMMISSGANGVVTSKPTLMAVKTSSSSSSSQPLSPGNSVLAEMLSSQEEMPSVRTPQGCPSPSLGGSVERQLEELMGAPPPNVEIRPSSFPHPHHQRPAVHSQQVPLHQLLASLSQQQQQHSAQFRPQHQQHPLSPSPQQQQQQQTLNQVALHSLHGSSHHHLNLKPHHQQQQSQSCTPGQPPSSQPQSHLTQLLQRPIPNQQSHVTTPPPPPHTATSHHHQLILHHHHPQQQTPPPRSPQATNSNPYHYTQHHQAHLTSPNLPSPLNLRNTNINTTTITAAANSPLHHQQQQLPSHQPSHLPPAAVVGQNSRTVPLKLNISKTPIDHSVLSGETQFSSSTPTSLTKAAVAAQSSNGNPTLNNNPMQAVGGGKLITIIRSSSGGPTQQGIMVNNNHQNQIESSSPGVLEDGNIISINLSGLGDVDGASSSSSSSGTPASSSKAKLKEAISQRNLLRLNFEQVPSGAGDSTVLLSSSSSTSNQSTGASTPTAPANNVTNTVQFIGKVSSSTTGAAPVGGPQARVSWNTTNYS